MYGTVVKNMGLKSALVSVLTLLLSLSDMLGK